MSVLLVVISNVVCPLSTTTQRQLRSSVRSYRVCSVRVPARPASAAAAGQLQLLSRRQRKTRQTKLLQEEPFPQRVLCGWSLFSENSMRLRSLVMMTCRNEEARRVSGRKRDIPEATTCSWQRGPPCSATLTSDETLSGAAAESGYPAQGKTGGGARL